MLRKYFDRHLHKNVSACLQYGQIWILFCLIMFSLKFDLFLEHTSQEPFLIPNSEQIIDFAQIQISRGFQNLKSNVGSYDMSSWIMGKCRHATTASDPTNYRSELANYTPHQCIFCEVEVCYRTIVFISLDTNKAFDSILFLEVS